MQTSVCRRNVSMRLTPSAQLQNKMIYYHNKKTKELIALDPETNEIEVLQPVGTKEEEVRDEAPKDLPTEEPPKPQPKPKKKSSATPERTEKIKALLKEGMRAPLIAEAEGVHVATVYNIKKSMRDAGELPGKKEVKEEKEETQITPQPSKAGRRVDPVRFHRIKELQAAGNNTQQIIDADEFSFTIEDMEIVNIAMVQSTYLGFKEAAKTKGYKY